MYLTLFCVVCALILGTLMPLRLLVVFTGLILLASIVFITIRLVYRYLKNDSKKTNGAKKKTAAGSLREGSQEGWRVRLSTSLLGWRFSISFASLFCFGAALLWGSYFTWSNVNHRLPLATEAVIAEISGCIVSSVDTSVGNYNTQVSRFDLRLSDNTLSPKGLRYVRLSWYRPDQLLQKGDCAEFTVSLRAPRNLANGLSFDYEAFLMNKSIDASGYIRKINPVETDFTETKVKKLTQQAPNTESNKNNNLAPSTHTLSPEKRTPNQRWISGLVFGDKQAFSPDQWSQVRQTGTLHLLVVSGLHIALVMFACNALIRWPARLVFSLFRYSEYRIEIVVALLSIVIGAGYVVLAGSGVSLIRAWIMASLLLLWWSSGRSVKPMLIWWLALSAVLVLNPLAWTQSGFWYSFGAVAALLVFHQGKKYGWIEPWFVPQLVILLALTPVMMQWDQTVTLNQIAANMLAIPILSFVLLPLTFGTFLFADTALGGLLTKGLLQVDTLFWWLQAHLLSLPQIYIPYWDIATSLLWLAVLALGILGASLRWVVLILFSTLILSFFMVFPRTEGVWLLDAGQGQSLVVSDSEHTIVIDTGAAFSDKFSIAQAILLPMLRRFHVTDLDVLIVSHEDNDHAGDVSTLLAQLLARQLYIGQNLDELSQPDAQRAINCHTVESKILVSDVLSYRFFPVPETARKNDNDSSCVVQISWYQYKILIPGDLSTQGEATLIRNYGNALASDLLIAGHHGSKTSTSLEWLNAVQPEEVWISAGFGNRYGHPHDEVVKRITSLGIKVRNTANDGRISLGISKQDKGSHVVQEINIETERSSWQPPWRWP
ncbi:MAG: DNA internalization-related competence protein ComEC/Rec2 [Oleibacter sp.]|nr:DNA internalization-related competence protein ComEC/Rec2 [Thalassolituus sp.]